MCPLNATGGIRCLVPDTTLYLYPNITGAVKKMGCGDHESFRWVILDGAGVSSCTRLHFGDALEGETEYYLRPAYSGVSTSQIVEGLGKLKAFVDAGGPTGPQRTPEEKRR